MVPAPVPTSSSPLSFQERRELLHLAIDLGGLRLVRRLLKEPVGTWGYYLRNAFLGGYHPLRTAVVDPRGVVTQLA